MATWDAGAMPPIADHFGWVGFEENSISPGRAAGTMLVARGVALVRAS
jgi:uncharacterized membrane protein YdcZ (DUF606 family)